MSTAEAKTAMAVVRTAVITDALLRVARDEYRHCEDAMAPGHADQDQLAQLLVNGGLSCLST